MVGKWQSMQRLLGRFSLIALAVMIGFLYMGGLPARADTDYYPAAFYGSAFDNSSQVIVVTNNPMNNVNATVSAYEKTGNGWKMVFSNISALIGQNGMQYDSLRRQDTNTTPSGVYGIPFAFGWAQNPGTKLPYRVADSNSYWDENSGSSTYNRWVEGNPGGECEQIATQPLYKYAMALDYNWNQTPGKGAGIFIHIKPRYYTGGCVGVGESELVQLMQWVDPTQNPKVLICPQADFSQYYYAQAIPAGLSAIDSPQANSMQMDSVTVNGWELAHTGVSRVDFYVDNDQWLGSTNALYKRDDVQASANQDGYYIDPDKCGYSFTFNTHILNDGLHTLITAGIANDGTVQWQTRSFYTRGGAITDIDSPQSTVYGGDISVNGWMLNRSGQQRVDFYLDNFKWLGSNDGAFQTRNDVQAIINADNLFSPNGTLSGYHFTIPAASIGPGTHTLYVAGIGADGTVKWNTRTFSVEDSRACLDTPFDTVAGDVRVSGWALNHAGMTRIDTYLDLGAANPKGYQTDSFYSRPDVRAAVDPAGRYPDSGRSGFAVTIPAADLTPGAHTVNVAAIGADGTAQWMVRAFTVAPSITDIDAPVSGATYAGNMLIGGWALNHAGISRVDVYAINHLSPNTYISLGSVTATQMGGRSDVQAAFKDTGYPGALQSGYTLVVKNGTLAAGQYTLCVAGIGNDGSVQWQNQTFSIQ
ncbi:MAG: L,D-transpeptidase family protein [Ethanoligenens sp.]